MKGRSSPVEQKVNLNKGLLKRQSMRVVSEEYIAGSRSERRPSKYQSIKGEIKAFLQRLFPARKRRYRPSHFAGADQAADCQVRSP